MQSLAHHWATEYDWRMCENALNALPHFITEINGLDIHFIHMRSKHDDALPIVINHGWPGSIIEQLKLIDRLVDPTVHGGSGADAFHVVIPRCRATDSQANRPQRAGVRSAWLVPGPS